MGLLHFVAWQVLKVLYKLNALYRKTIDWGWVTSRNLLFRFATRILSKETGFIKLPKHLAVIFLPSCFEPEDFVPLFDNLVEWCILFKISYLTLYCPDFCESFGLNDFISSRTVTIKADATDKCLKSINPRALQLDQKTSTITASNSSGHGIFFWVC